MAQLLVDPRAFSDCAQRISAMYETEAKAEKDWRTEFRASVSKFLDEAVELRDFQLKWQNEILVGQRTALEAKLAEAQKRIGEMSRYIAELQSGRAA